ncbi:MAG: hypothetical protein HC780_01340 [Leptolyngbyaceae cyanobacterium CSU_1_3]|nr:hypothetical protein [Leptolyngbyaceae cyanobacterium CSU_1_3]
MTWKAYRVVFKLKSPVHIGCGKVGNVQRTRPYVTGRVFWGALTMRLTRDAISGTATDSSQYKTFGDKVNEQLAYTYFYLATKENGVYQIQWPWGDEESLFRRRFLSSYTSTALMYLQQAADEGLLHEVEFLSPRTLDEGEQVYLVGYVFEKEGCDLKWRDACKHLQLGGERGYGWGDVKCVEIKPLENHDLFEEQVTFNGDGDSPTIQAKRLLAHASSTGITATGEIEPLVGREWRSNESTNKYAGQYVAFSDLCWVPGSVVERSLFVIRDFGIWHLSD